MIKTTYDSEPISIRQLVPNTETDAQKMNKKSLQDVIKNHTGVLALSLAAIRAFIQEEMPDLCRLYHIYAARIGGAI